MSTKLVKQWASHAIVIVTKFFIKKPNSDCNCVQLKLKLGTFDVIKNSESVYIDSYIACGTFSVGCLIASLHGICQIGGRLER